ncbi:MAG: hypothetical protein KAH14_03760 [Clostridiales bacterium]|nr:hypothetical protein [Clostridiales bacterium]
MEFDKVYPPGSLNETRAILRRFWERSGKTVYSTYSLDYDYRQMENIDEMSKNADLNLEAGRQMPGYNIPRLLIDFGTISTASYWGGKIYKPDGGRLWINPVINNIDDVSKLKSKPPETGDVERAALIYKTISKKLKTNNLPCTVFDIQGPLNTLSLMWEQQDFMMAMYDYPKIVHAALEKVTDHIIKTIKAFFNHIPSVESPLWPYIWLPQDIGIGLTEDYMPLLSPVLYKEFGIPYLKRISNEFGGLFIHCCGQFTHHIDNLVESGVNIIGMEFAYPGVDIEKLFKTFGPTAVFVPSIMDKCIPEFSSLTGYFKYVDSLRTPNTRLWYILRPDLDDFNDQVEFLESITDAV